MITYSFTRRGTAKHPTFAVRKYLALPDGTQRGIGILYYEGKEAFELITKLHESGFEEIETGDPFMYVLQKGAA